MQIGRGEPSVRENLFGGTGTCLVWDLLGSTPAAPFTAVLSCELAERGRVGRHVQQRDSEIVIGLSGCGEAKVDGRAIPFGPGAVVYLRFGASLELTNERSDAPLTYLIIKATPPG
jgi:mannose-6-phosphate isomerase-like protein (cupin superfamily)